MAPGAKFRKAFRKAYVVDDPGGLALLEHACAALDRISDLEAVLVADGLVATGSTGQPVAHPALDAIRKERDSFARLLRDLEPPPEPKGSGGASAAGKSLVRARWDR